MFFPVFVGFLSRMNNNKGLGLKQIAAIITGAETQDQRRCRLNSSGSSSERMADMAMENGHRNSEFSIKHGDFPSFLLCLPEGN